ncbi:hypothetical protein LZ31DRAFT_160315 [Colletotrichum somersetense]|nr:hypothetical protein LZ31DRAFT_160315 [Colletotrichum somersetense]
MNVASPDITQFSSTCFLADGMDVRSDYATWDGSAGSGGWKGWQWLVSYAVLLLLCLLLLLSRLSNHHTSRQRAYCCRLHSARGPDGGGHCRCLVSSNRGGFFFSCFGPDWAGGCC